METVFPICSLACIMTLLAYAFIAQANRDAARAQALAEQLRCDLERKTRQAEQWEQSFYTSEEQNDHLRDTVNELRGALEENEREEEEEEDADGSEFNPERN